MATSSAHILSGTAKMLRPQSAHEGHSYTRHPLVPSIATMNGSWGNSDATSEIRVRISSQPMIIRSVGKLRYYQYPAIFSWFWKVLRVMY